MRAVVMLVIGLLVGALGAVTAVGAMKQDVPLTKATMTLMGHHFGALREMGKGGQCDAPAMSRHLRGLQGLSGEFDVFLPTGGDNAAFRKHADAFIAAIDGANAAPPADCKALAITQQTLGGACKACHQEFRG